MNSVVCFKVFLLIILSSPYFAFNSPVQDTNSQTLNSSTALNSSSNVQFGCGSKNCDQTKRRLRYIPFSKPTVSNSTEQCQGSSADDFPELFTRQQNENGAVILCFLIGLYGFTLLAIVCDSYFLPCVERICESMNLSEDVAAATFMSIATSCPELFTNLIGTFITESDIGIGTIVGSSLFNALGVASIGGLAAVRPIKLDWWPVTRDVFIYIMAVSLLVVISWDNKIYWYEALVLFIAYFIYFTIMFQNVRISKLIRKLAAKYKLANRTVTITSASNGGIENNNCPNPIRSKSANRLEIAVISNSGRYSKNSASSHYGSYSEDIHRIDGNVPSSKEFVPDDDETESIFAIPNGSIWKKLFYFYTFPIKLVLFFTIPNPRKYPKLFPLAFVMCILWIGSNSYIISWMISIIGNVFRIPDAVLGLTFLAAGGCLPESISITIMSRRGEGSMGVSNSLGANTMNILLSLGMPWFFKTISKGANSSAFIEIQSGSIEYTILALVAVAIALYFTLYFNKFRLSKSIGIILLCIYLGCVVLAILSELVFFKNHIQHCNS